MKRIAITLLFQMILSTPIYTGELTGKGIKIGINLAKSTGGFISEPEYKLGFIGGVFIAYNISSLFSIQSEILFSMKGYRIDNQYYNWWTDVELNYLDIPIMAKMRILNKLLDETHIYGGPAFCYNLSAKYEFKLENIIDKGNLDDVNKFDFGLVFGSSTTFNLKAESIILDIRYNLGLISWDKTDGRYKNRVISIMVGYSI